MREILFRGKRKDNGEWVSGYLWIGANNTFITPYNFGISFDDVKQKISAGAYEVIPETVGQYTGLTDKNGKKIFEGDIVKLFLKNDLCEIGPIMWSCIDARYKFASQDGTSYGINCTCEFENIGNIHDNPELLKEAEANE